MLILIAYCAFASKKLESNFFNSNSTPG
jgi:hypothetical protein